MAAHAKRLLGLTLAVAALTSLISLTGISQSQAAADDVKADPKQQVITISPTLQKLSLGPGLIEAKAYVEVTNSTNYRYTANIQLVDFKTLDQTGALSLGQVGVPLWKYGLASWMKASSNVISLSPGASTKVEVTIENRADLTPGGHYGAVVLARDSSDQTSVGNNKVAFNQNLVSLLFIKKLGGEKYGLELDSLKIDQKRDLPESIATSFRSTGNVYVIPRGYIEVTDPNGKVVQKGVINPNSSIILQGSSTKLITLLTPIANSNVSGKYKITAYYRYEGQKDYSTKSIYFDRSNSNAKPIAIGLITVVIALILTYKLVQRRRKK